LNTLLASEAKLKVKVEKPKAMCPYCGRELVKLRYFGMKHFAVDRESPDFKYNSLDDLEEDGRVVWQEVVSVGWRGSGSYED
jgi:hypothetical protein